MDTSAAMAVEASSAAAATVYRAMMIACMEVVLLVEFWTYEMQNYDCSCVVVQS